MGLLSLPSEVLYIICWNASPMDLFNFRMACKGLFEICQPILRQSVTVIDDFKDPDVVYDLLNHREIGLFVREVSISDCPTARFNILESERKLLIKRLENSTAFTAIKDYYNAQVETYNSRIWSDDNDPGEPSLERDLKQGAQSTILAILLPQLSNLTTLALDMFSYKDFEFYAPVLKSLAFRHSPPVMPHLENVILSATDAFQGGVLHPEIMCIFKTFFGVRSMSVSHLDCYNRHVVVCDISPSSLSQLTLNALEIEQDEPRHWLRTFLEGVELRIFKYTNVDSIQSEFDPLDIPLSAIDMSKKTLEELTITSDSLSAYMDGTRLSNMYYCINLRYLETHCSWCPVTKLPPSLQRLRLLFRPYETRYAHHKCLVSILEVSDKKQLPNLENVETDTPWHEADPRLSLEREFFSSIAELYQFDIVLRSRSYVLLRLP